MKKIFFLLITIFALISCGEKEIDISKKQVRNGVVYTVNSDTPFSGKIIGKYPNGQTEVLENYINGKPNGEQISYYENGQIKEKICYEQGIPIGDFVRYYDNGSIAYDGKYVNGLKEGNWNIYDENKQLLVTKQYQKGNLISIQQHLVDVDKIKTKINSLFN